MFYFFTLTIMTPLALPLFLFNFFLTPKFLSKPAAFDLNGLATPEPLSLISL